MVHIFGSAVSTQNMVTNFETLFRTGIIVFILSIYSGIFSGSAEICVITGRKLGTKFERLKMYVSALVAIESANYTKGFDYLQ